MILLKKALYLWPDYFFSILNLFSIMTIYFLEFYLFYLGLRIHILSTKIINRNSCKNSNTNSQLNNTNHIRLSFLRKTYECYLKQCFYLYLLHIIIMLIFVRRIKYYSTMPKKVFASKLFRSSKLYRFTGKWQTDKGL